MKFLLVSDLHATLKTPENRKDNIKKTFHEKFLFIIKYAIKNKCIILQAGDFCNQPRDWQLMSFVISTLKKYKPKIYTIFGQHDSYKRANVEDSPTVLSILNKAGLVEILDKEPVKIKNIFLYGCGWEKEVPEVKDKNAFNILVIHSSISTKSIFPKQNFEQHKYFLRKHPDFNLILAGDIHRFFLYKNKKNRIILNTGPFLRLEATEYNLTHKPLFYIFDTTTTKLEKTLIPCRPGIAVLDRTKIESKKLEEKILEKFIGSINSVSVEKKNIKGFIIKEMKKSTLSRGAKIILLSLLDGRYK